MASDTRRNYSVLYTHQKTKKSKTWQDGLLKISAQGTRAILFDEKGSKLDAVYVKPHQVLVGEELESDRYLIAVEEEKAVRDTVFSHEVPAEQQQKQKQQEEGHQPMFGRQKRMSLKRKRRGFMVPRQASKKLVTEDGNLTSTLATPPPFSAVEQPEKLHSKNSIQKPSLFSTPFAGARELKNFKTNFLNVYESSVSLCEQSLDHSGTVFHDNQTTVSFSNGDGFGPPITPKMDLSSAPDTANVSTTNVYLCHSDELSDNSPLKNKQSHLQFRENKRMHPDKFEFEQQKENNLAFSEDCEINHHFASHSDEQSLHGNGYISLKENSSKVYGDLNTKQSPLAAERRSTSQILALLGKRYAKFKPPIKQPNAISERELVPETLSSLATDIKDAVSPHIPVQVTEPLKSLYSPEFSKDVDVMTLLGQSAADSSMTPTCSSSNTLKDPTNSISDYGSPRTFHRQYETEMAQVETASISVERLEHPESMTNEPGLEDLTDIQRRKTSGEEVGGIAQQSSSTIIMNSFEQESLDQDHDLGSHHKVRIMKEKENQNYEEQAQGDEIQDNVNQEERSSRSQGNTNQDTNKDNDCNQSRRKQEDRKHSESNLDSKNRRLDSFSQVERNKAHRNELHVDTYRDRTEDICNQDGDLHSENYEDIAQECNCEDGSYHGNGKQNGHFWDISNDSESHTNAVHDESYHGSGNQDKTDIENQGKSVENIGSHGNRKSDSCNQDEGNLCSEDQRNTKSRGSCNNDSFYGNMNQDGFNEDETCERKVAIRGREDFNQVNKIEDGKNESGRNHGNWEYDVSLKENRTQRDEFNKYEENLNQCDGNKDERNENETMQEVTEVQGDCSSLDDGKQDEESNVGRNKKGVTSDVVIITISSKDEADRRQLMLLDSTHHDDEKLLKNVIEKSEWCASETSTCTHILTSKEAGMDDRSTSVHQICTLCSAALCSSQNTCMCMECANQIEVEFESSWKSTPQTPDITKLDQEYGPLVEDKVTEVTSVQWKTQQRKMEEGTSWMSSFDLAPWCSNGESNKTISDTEVGVLAQSIAAHAIGQFPRDEFECLDSREQKVISRNTQMESVPVRQMQMRFIEECPRKCQESVLTYECSPPIETTQTQFKDVKASTFNNEDSLEDWLRSIEPFTRAEEDVSDSVVPQIGMLLPNVTGSEHEVMNPAVGEMRMGSTPCGDTSSGFHGSLEKSENLIWEQPPVLRSSSQNCYEFLPETPSLKCNLKACHLSSWTQDMCRTSQDHSEDTNQLLKKHERNRWRNVFESNKKCEEDNDNWSQHSSVEMERSEEEFTGRVGVHFTQPAGFDRWSESPGRAKKTWIYDARNTCIDQECQNVGLDTCIVRSLGVSVSQSGENSGSSDDMLEQWKASTSVQVTPFSPRCWPMFPGDSQQYAELDARLDQQPDAFTMEKDSSAAFYSLHSRKRDSDWVMRMPDKDSVSSLQFHKQESYLPSYDADEGGLPAWMQFCQAEDSCMPHLQRSGIDDASISCEGTISRSTGKDTKKKRDYYWYNPVSSGTVRRRLELPTIFQARARREDSTCTSVSIHTNYFPYLMQEEDIPLTGLMKDAPQISTTTCRFNQDGQSSHPSLAIVGGKDFGSCLHPTPESSAEIDDSCFKECPTWSYHQWT
ncbi:uncharacterized protein LOC110984500 isoform X2 [Acanthaster planci]|uniref:Uncharacterized protein LOC110984500 isoform X2 n=1 Tax=Acanthaster planci TaxID=133434 RepID=A0A8B7Z4L2_ACAPL|nr:uncharacterized protein LOC110984500 isoform X2 [Acanthaster planci]